MIMTAPTEISTNPTKSSLQRVSISAAEQSQDDSEALRIRKFTMLLSIVEEMQNDVYGLVVKDRKQFLERVPSCFTGKEIVEWLVEVFQLKDRFEAFQVAQLIFSAGYIFPLEYNPLFRDSPNELYRFQCRYFYPKQNERKPKDFEYAVYLCKRTLRDKKKHSLEDYENEEYLRIQLNLKRRWEFVVQQATEQVRFSKERSSHEKKIFDSQERAFWWKHRPPPKDYVTVQTSLRKLRGLNQAKDEETAYQESLSQSGFQDGIQLVTYLEDKMVRFKAESENRKPRPAQVSEEKQVNVLSVWEEQVTTAMVKKWANSFQDLLEDEVGLVMFQIYLKKEFSDENIKFWYAVEELKNRVEESLVVSTCHHIFNTFIAPSAPYEVNVDATTRQITTNNMEVPSRDTFQEAQRAVFLLMSKDSYPRFIKSPECQSFLASES